MALPMMPKATAVWLIDNTALTFEQIAEFCGMHVLEVQAIADGDVATGMTGLDPIAAGQLTAEEIRRCEGDPTARLKLEESDMPMPQARTKGGRYTPVSKRGEKPDAISWVLRHHPELTDTQIGRLLGTTKETIAKVRDRTHWKADLRPRDPVDLGFCSREELMNEVRRARERGGVPAAEAAPEEPAEQDAQQDAQQDA